MKFTRHVLMGDPSCFQIRYGANPHTRNRWGMRKRVDRIKALRQWEDYASALLKEGVKVHLLDPDPKRPGLVFPANAGVVLHAERALPLEEREYLLAQAGPTRAAEREVYARCLASLGLRLHQIHKRFEGEADWILWGEKYLFTYGPVFPAHWQWRWAWPPWQRRYGFRSERAALFELESCFNPVEVLALELQDEAFYHGDTLLCSFGARREFLLVYPPALTPESWKKLEGLPGIFPMETLDAQAFVANGFQVIREGKPVLFLPPELSSGLRRKLEAQGVRIVTVDVSEFFLKGGGSLKCMVGDLGADQGSLVVA